MLTSEAKRVLAEAGWFEGRHVDTSSYLQQWTDRGITPTPDQVEFAAEFCGLTIYHPPSIEVGGKLHRDYTILDPPMALSGLRDDMIEKYHEVSSEPLCPVGNNRSHMTLFLGNSGALYGGVDNYLSIFGSDPTTALSRICEGARPRLIGQWRV